MKLLYEKDIKVKSRTYELVKKPRPENQGSGYVPISSAELNGLTINDNVKLIVLDRNNKQIAVKILPYQDLMDRLQKQYRNSPYRLLKYK